MLRGTDHEPYNMLNGATATVGDDDVPFRGWLVSGEKYESFTIGGAFVRTEYSVEEKLDSG